MENTHMNNRATLYHHLLIQVNVMRILNVANIARRKFEGEGTSTLKNTKRLQRSGEGVKQLFPKECKICIYSGTMKIKYKELFPCLLTLQTSADAIVRFTNIKEDGDMLKIVFHGNMLEREFMVHGKCYREYTRLPKDETVRCLTFYIISTRFLYHNCPQ